MDFSPTNSQTSSRGRGRGRGRGGATAGRGRGSKAVTGKQHLEMVEEKEEPKEPTAKKRKLNEDSDPEIPMGS